MLGMASLPGFAHGDEPHGDEPHPVAAADAGGPRFEAATDLFEAVGRLDDGKLTLFINRFATNEPVLEAKVELESGALKAVAAFQADQGSYVVNDGPFVKALRQAGTHAVVLTVTAGEDADLLDGSLSVSSAGSVDAALSASNALTTMTVAIGTALLAALAAGVVWMRRRSRSVQGVGA
jgi:hypothetical protein